MCEYARARKTRDNRRRHSRKRERELDERRRHREEAPRPRRGASRHLARVPSLYTSSTCRRAGTRSPGVRYNKSGKVSRKMPELLKNVLLESEIKIEKLLLMTVQITMFSSEIS